MKNASFSYDGKTDIFADLNCTIKSGEVFCILGPNGTGKSTLLNCLMNFQRIKQGEILLDDVNITKIETNELAKRIALIPQTHQLSFPYKVIDLVLMGRTPHLNSMSSPSGEDYDAAVSAIETVGIGDLAYRPCSQLSGGQLQLVMFARALAQQSDMILLDEPTSHLDFGNQMRALDAIFAMRDKGIGMIMTSHYPDHAFLGCDRVAIMSEKTFKAVGPPDEVVTEEALREIYKIDIRVMELENGIGRKVCIPLRKGFNSES
ncbi:MAG: ABC transporter ATP-binding protein [Muricomes sp.]